MVGLLKTEHIAYILSGDIDIGRTILLFRNAEGTLMEEIFVLIADVGAPIAGSLVMGFFIFTVIKQILNGIVDQIKTLTMFCESLQNRARTMSSEMMKIDLLVSSALDLRPDIDRISRAENFVEDGKVDARRD